MSESRVTILFTLAKGTSVEDVGERLVDWLASDPLDLFPEIESVDGWTAVSDE